jgi:alpha-glucosidase (family GH31 glycosyl hydrolase)
VQNSLDLGIPVSGIAEAVFARSLSSKPAQRAAASGLPGPAETLSVDPASGEPVAFDIANPAFADAYFTILHHPHEADGVDFWWLDWQQGTQTKVQGLDPLGWLNHLHFYYLGRDGRKRPFIFSRWGGLGNHRYPIGFSGDTVVSWESLAVRRRT